jgi:crotonobetainyl-CoA:carnitine CoA-transferase CaiB-like acyl-CoA transferase
MDLAHATSSRAAWESSGWSRAVYSSGQGGSDMAGPLDGIRVVDLTTVASGPLATAILADQGADVVKVEPVDGADIMRQAGARRGGMAAIFAVLNRGKRGLRLDLRHPRGLEILRELVRRADVVAQNFRPGVAERMGIGYDDLRPLNPGLVYLSITGFGERGPYAAKRVYDPIVQAISGTAAGQPRRDTGEPDLIQSMVCDKVTAQVAAQAVTAALLARERGAGGQHVRLSMLDAAIAFAWPDVMINQTLLGEGVEPAPGMGDLYRLSRSADGHVVTFTMSDAEFAGLCRALGSPELTRDPRFADINGRAAHYGELRRLLAAGFEALTSAELCARLDAEQVPCGPVNALEALAADPQVVANGTLIESEHPCAGRMRQPRPPARFEATPAAIRGPAPRAGEHTDALLRELGHSPEEIEALRRAGAVG